MGTVHHLNPPRDLAHIVAQRALIETLSAKVAEPANG